VGGRTTGYAYKGDDVRVQKSQGMATTSYLWDRVSGLPLLVDDGTTGYVHADGMLAQVAAGGTPRWLLADALGSVRGAADATGAQAGSADYEAFGAVRGTSTTASVFGFTGEQTDAETGFVFLRARYHDPRVGRFLSRDAVQPNASGTQGYHASAYAANNPTTWTDPSGQQLLARRAAAVTPPMMALLLAEYVSLRNVFGQRAEDCGEGAGGPSVRRPVRAGPSRLTVR
jgi:RHS repeat-associated protein